CVRARTPQPATGTGSEQESSMSEADIRAPTGAPPTGARQLFRFGEFELDDRARELRRGGRRVRLQEQPFQILRALLDRAGEVVTREELRQRVWPSSVYVDFDHGLNNAIARLRDALGDGATTSGFIETLPRLGYRFTVPVTRVSTAIPVAPARKYWNRS